MSRQQRHQATCEWGERRAWVKFSESLLIA